MAGPGSAAALFSGLLGGASEGILTAQKQKHDQEIQRNQQLTSLYLKGIENGDIAPEHGFPLIAGILSGSFSTLTGDKKGSAKDKSAFKDLLADPNKLSSLLMGVHAATKGSPASGPAGPTGLPVSGPVPVGEGQTRAAAESGQESVLPSSSTTMVAPARTSIFRTQAEKEQLVRSRETFKTNEAIRAAKEEGRYTAKPTITTVPGMMSGADILKTNPNASTFSGLPLDPTTSYQRVQIKHGDQMIESFTQGPEPKSTAPIGNYGQAVSKWLGDRGQTWDKATPELRQAALQGAVLTADEPKRGTPAEFFKQREQELGHKMSGTELLQARNDYSKAGQAETPEQKLAMAKALADYRNTLVKPTDAASLAADVTTTTTGAKYIDLSQYSVTERKAARDWANANGVTPTSKEQTNALIAVDTARLNMAGMKETILGKLPKDAAGRVTTGLGNRIGAYFQTDEDLAAWGAWRESAVQQVRAMQGVGSGQYRLTQQMVNLIINNDIPTLTDTVGTAQRKLDTVSKQLNDVENSITVRDRTSLVPPPKSESVPPSITTRLKTAPAAKYRDTATNTYWLKTADGKITPISKTEYEK